MNGWLAVQFAYAVSAWWFCARPVANAEHFGAAAGRELAATIRELRAAGQGGVVQRLPELLGIEALADLLELDPRTSVAEQFVERANAVTRAVAPPTRVLRSIATVGTMLGLLASVASLHGALDSAGAAAMQAAAGRAFDSAVLGFVTAIPCWTAAALCGRRARQSDIELESVLLALTADETDPSGGPPRASIEHAP